MSDWKDKGNCRDYDNDDFFGGFHYMTREEKKKVIAICEACSVRPECYEYAVKTKSWGVWAGKEFRDGKPYNPMRTRERADMTFPKKRVA